MTRQKIQIRLAHLKTLVETAEREIALDNSLSDTIEISMDDPTDCHLGSDNFDAWLKSAYAECIGKRVW